MCQMEVETNRFLRQYFPKGTYFSAHLNELLDAVAWAISENVSLVSNPPIGAFI